MIPTNPVTAEAKVPTECAKMPTPAPIGDRCNEIITQLANTQNVLEDLLFIITGEPMAEIEPPIPVSLEHQIDIIANGLDSVHAKLMRIRNCI